MEIHSENDGVPICAYFNRILDKHLNEAINLCIMVCEKKKLKIGYIIKFFLGTSKINKNCTCTIKLIEKQNGTFVSEVNRNHYGHENKFGHI